MINLRRRTYIGVLLFLVGGLFALIIAMTLLRDRRGTLIVNADKPDGYVVLNGALTNTRVGNPIKRLRPDTYNVSVYLKGFQSRPINEVVKVAAGQTVEVSFSLEPLPPEPEPSEKIKEAKRDPFAVAEPAAAGHSAVSPSRDTSERRRETSAEQEKLSSQADDRRLATLKIVTRPVQGSIFLDDIFKGAGKVTLTDVDLGEVVVRFGETEGYRTPAPQKVFLTQDWPYASIEGIYLPLIYVSAYLDPYGRSITMKCRIQTGYVLAEAENYQDPVAGPGVKLLDELGIFTWEIGYAYSNRNPPGEDFLEIVFELPENYDGNKTLELQLYGYASDKKYPFAISGKTAIDVIVNARKVKENFQPRVTLSAGASSEPDVFPINAFLQAGQNRIRIKASASSRSYYYLRQVVVL